MSSQRKRHGMAHEKDNIVYVVTTSFSTIPNLNRRLMSPCLPICALALHVGSCNGHKWVCGSSRNLCLVITLAPPGFELRLDQPRSAPTSQLHNRSTLRATTQLRSSCFRLSASQSWIVKSVLQTVACEGIRQYNNYIQSQSTTARRILFTLYRDRAHNSNDTTYRTLGSNRKWLCLTPKTSTPSSRMWPRMF